MFDSAELKALRQEIDGLTEQVRILIEGQEMQHQEVLAKLDELEVLIRSTENEGIGERIDEIESGVSEVKDIVTNIDEHLGEGGNG